MTDLDRSERFYTDVFDLIRVMDFGHGRILHRQTGFMFAVTTHEGAQGSPFTELATGLDHLAFSAESRDELVAWEQKLDAPGIAYTPIRDMELGRRTLHETGPLHPVSMTPRAPGRSQ